jgi:hypothetical protein
MAILKCLTIIAVLLAGATSVAIAQNGLPDRRRASSGRRCRGRSVLRPRLPLWIRVPVPPAFICLQSTLPPVLAALLNQSRGPANIDERAPLPAALVRPEGEAFSPLEISSAQRGRRHGSCWRA